MNKAILSMLCLPLIFLIQLNLALGQVSFEERFLEGNRFYKIFHAKGDWCREVVTFDVVYIPEIFNRIREYQLKTTSSGSGLQNTLMRYRKKLCPTARMVLVNLYRSGEAAVEQQYLYDYSYDSRSNSERFRLAQEGLGIVAQNVKSPRDICRKTQEGKPWSIAASERGPYPSACQMLLAFDEFLVNTFKATMRTRPGCSTLRSGGCIFGAFGVVNQVIVTHFEKDKCFSNGECTFTYTLTCRASVNERTNPAISGIYCGPLGFLPQMSRTAKAKFTPLGNNSLALVPPSRKEGSASVYSGTEIKELCPTTIQALRWCLPEE